MKKVLFATPAYHGVITTQYTLALLRTWDTLKAEKQWHPTLFTVDSDSLISRARNRCANVALNGGFDCLLFIDSDIIFTPEHVKLLLDSDKDIIGGTYPLKTFPVMPNLNPLPEHYDLYGPKRNMATFHEYANKYGNEKGEVEVMHCPTGFLKINTSVFEKLKESRPRYTSRSAGDPELHEFHDYFPIRVVPPPDNPKASIYETEDWGFCSIARDAGFKVYLQTKVRLSHIGQHIYKL